MAVKHQAGQDHLVSTSLLKHKPKQMPIRSLDNAGPASDGRVEPCICMPAQEAAEDDRGMGHLRMTCGRCHDQLRKTTFYEPPHDVRPG